MENNQNCIYFVSFIQSFPTTHAKSMLPTKFRYANWSKSHKILNEAIENRQKTRYQRMMQNNMRKITQKNHDIPTIHNIL